MLAVVPVTLFAEEDLKQVAVRAEEWVRAAENRESAAITQQAQSETQLMAAQALRKKEFKNEKERIKNFKQAGDTERDAGNLQAKAAVNFDLAAANWLSAAKEYGKLNNVGDPQLMADKVKNATIMHKLALNNGTFSLQKTAQAYELAAEAYGAANANDPGWESWDREMAAVYRETLARRQ